MKLLRFSNEEEYRELQIETNKRKLKKVWSSRIELSIVAKYVKKTFGKPSFGLCHGARNGFEVHFLRQALNCEVLGTDISPTANQFQHLVEWDFHEINPSWDGRADFVFTNSLDHACNPRKALEAWQHSLKSKGLLFIESGESKELPKAEIETQEEVNLFPNAGADCFLFDVDSLILWIKKTFDTLAIIEKIPFMKKTPFTKGSKEYQLLVLQNQ